MAAETDPLASQQEISIYLKRWEDSLSRATSTDDFKPLDFLPLFDMARLPAGFSKKKFIQAGLLWMLNLVRLKYQGQLPEKLSAIAARLESATNSKGWQSLTREPLESKYRGITAIVDSSFGHQFYPTDLVALPALKYQDAGGKSAVHPPHLLIVEDLLEAGILTFQCAQIELTLPEPSLKDLYAYQSGYYQGGEVTANFKQPLYEVIVTTVPTSAIGLTRTTVTLHEGVSLADPNESPAILAMAPRVKESEI